MKEIESSIALRWDWVRATRTSMRALGLLASYQDHALPDQRTLVDFLTTAELFWDSIQQLPGSSMHVGIPLETFAKACHSTNLKIGLRRLRAGLRSFNPYRPYSCVTCELSELHWRPTHNEDVWLRDDRKTHPGYRHRR